MNMLRIALPLVLVGHVASAKEPVKAADKAAAPAKAERSLPAFEKMKTLLGTWTAKRGDGKVATLTYELVSGKTAIMERMEAGDHDMVTMYHPDGARLMMTHYCAANNQPRMRTETGAADKDLRFSYVDATNLKSPADGHMQGLVIHFDDDRHLTQEWTYVAAGKPATDKFVFERKQ